MNKSVLPLACLIVAVVCLLAPRPVSAHEPDSGGELARIARTLEEVVRLLAADSKARRGETLLERLKIESNRVLPLEESLRELTERRRGLEGDLEVLSLRILAEERRLEDELAEGAPPEEQVAARLQLEMVRAERARLSEEVTALEFSIADVESELSRRRADYESLREQVDAALGLR